MDSPNWAIPEKNKPGQSFPFDACNMCHKFDASNKKQHTQFMYMLYGTQVLGHQNEENERKNKNIKFNG